MTAGTVLVTGGAGFVGSHVVRGLLAAGSRPVVLDSTVGLNALDAVLAPTEREALVLEQGDVADGWGLLRLCERHEVERIVHLASPLTAAIRQSPAAGLAAMCGGTANVLEVARALRLGRVVWASSISVFGPGGPFSPDSPRRPESLYGSGKVLCEDLAAAYRADHGVESIGLRLAVLYGPWRLRGWEASFGQAEDPIRAAVVGAPIVVREPSRRLNWLYVDDAASLVCRALGAPAPDDHVFTTSGEAATRLEFSERIREAVPTAGITVEPDPEAPAADGADRSGELDDGALVSQIGYGTRHTLAEGIAATVAAYRRTEEPGATGA